MTSVSLEKSLKRIPKNLRTVEGLAAYTTMLKQFALPLAIKQERAKAKYLKKASQPKRKRGPRKNKTPEVVKEAEKVIETEPVHTLPVVESVPVPVVKAARRKSKKVVVVEPIPVAVKVKAVKAKRKLSPKQEAALAKGRAVRAAKRA
jgi:hypothetical protein